jgi:2-acylglycerol O-acyltransferase 2
MAPKTVKASGAPDPKSVKLQEKILGGFVIHCFVVMWISSIVSPFLLLSALYKGQTIWATIIILISVAAYAPWERGTLANFVHYAVYHYFPRYFKSMSIEFEGDKIPTTDDPQYFYAIHPHGAFSFGWAALFSHPQMQHVRFCFAPLLYISPFFRLFSRSTGRPGSAGKADMLSYMKRGESLALPPGGFEEATLTSPKHDRVYIKKRYGFVKLCLQHGIPIRPVYAFGEKELYWNIQGAWEARLAMNHKGLPAIVTWGHPLFPLMPRYNIDMKIVIGAPILLPKVDKPSKEVVKQWHDKYIAALTKLFEDHKEAAYGPEVAKTAKLEVW